MTNSRMTNGLVNAERGAGANRRSEVGGRRSEVGRRTADGGRTNWAAPICDLARLGATRHDWRAGTGILDNWIGGFMSFLGPRSAPDSTRGDSSAALGLIAHTPDSAETIGFKHGYRNIAHYCVGGPVTRGWRILLGSGSAALIAAPRRGFAKNCKKSTNGESPHVPVSVEFGVSGFGFRVWPLPLLSTLILFD